MPTCVPDDLTTADVGEFRGVMDACEWEDGRSGAQSSMVKSNEQLPSPPDIASLPSNEPAYGFTRDPLSSRRCVLLPAGHDPGCRIFDLDSVIHLPSSASAAMIRETVKLTGISQPRRYWAEA
jgi:hypothetical protein